MIPPSTYAEAATEEAAEGVVRSQSRNGPSDALARRSSADSMFSPEKILVGREKGQFKKQREGKTEEEKNRLEMTMDDVQTRAGLGAREDWGGQQK